jgi:hypothetical protein
VQSQKGALDRFVLKEPQVNFENQTPYANVDDGRGDSAVEVEVHIAEHDEGDDGNSGDEIDDANTNDEGNDQPDDEGNDANIGVEGNDATAHDDTNSSSHLDIFDPRYWDGLDPKTIDILLQKGPKRDLSIKHGPRGKNTRRFSALAYNRELPNGEICDREWLVYSKELDKIFCFCCKLLRKGHVRGLLANEGFSDWIHLSVRLQQHETSREHVTNMSGYDVRMRLQNNQTIDHVAQREIEKEREHWRKVLYRILLIVQFLREHNIALRGSNCSLEPVQNRNYSLGANPVRNRWLYRLTR